MYRVSRQQPSLTVVLLLCLLGLTACSSTRQPPPTGFALSDTRKEVVRAAAAQIGVPYRYGGANRRGFDCSGLVQYAHRAAGVTIPRTTKQQWKDGADPDRRYLLPGDLVFFSIDRKGRHVGIYEGDGYFIHAPSSGKTVGRASLDNPFWREHLIGTRSFL